jgi:hypothetical protein
MCFRQADFRAGQRDVLLGAIEECPFYVGASQFEYWAFFHISVDVTAGGGDSFSIEAPEGVRFIVRSRPFTDAEAAELGAGWPPPGCHCARCGGLTRQLSLQLRWSDWPQFNISLSS